MDAKTPAADELTDTLRRIAEALERLSPRAQAAPDLDNADAFVWHPDGKRLVPVPKVNRVDMSLLRGIDRYRSDFAAPDKAEQFIHHGDSPVPAGIDAHELAAYTAAASVILNLDETITQE